MDPRSLVFPVVLLLFALRIWRRGARQRRVRIERMWIGPAIFTALIGAGLSAAPPPLTAGVLVVMGAALALGLAVGWLRGRSVVITVEPESHTLKQQSSAFGMVLLAGLFLARQATRSYLQGHAADWNLSPVAITDGFLLFALGMVVGRRIEMMIRCLRLLGEARAAAARGETAQVEVTQEHA